MPRSRKAELATINKHQPPFWEERAWDPQTQPEELRSLYRALSRSSSRAIVREVNRLEASGPEWSQPAGRRRAGRVLFIDQEIIDAHMPRRSVEDDDTIKIAEAGLS